MRVREKKGSDGKELPSTSKNCGNKKGSIGNEDAVWVVEQQLRTIPEGAGEAKG